MSAQRLLRINSPYTSALRALAISQSPSDHVEQGRANLSAPLRIEPTRTLPAVLSWLPANPKMRTSPGGPANFGLLPQAP